MLKYFAFILLLGGIFFAISQLHVNYEDGHTSLNDHNLETDFYLRNAQYYMKENAYERSVFHIENAKKSLRELEDDIDLGSVEQIETAIHELDEIEAELLNDSLVTENMYSAFSRALQTISIAELRVSEKYAESNKMDISMVALKYAKLHLKNAINFSNLPNRKHGLEIYIEMDSLIRSPTSSPSDLAGKIDHLIKELDVMIKEKD